MECGTKVKHATRDDALQHQKNLVWMNHVRQTPERSKGLAVYPCSVCAGWHVGHQASAPLVWHYTIIHPYLERILASDCLKPARPRRPSRALLDDMTAQSRAYALAFLSEPRPLLWFSRNPLWDYSVMKVRMHEKDDDLGSRAYIGRAMTELHGEGLLRFGVSASLAKLRWGDYLARNPTPKSVRDTMTRYGDPTEWLATDERVALDRVQAVQVYYRGAWVDVGAVSDDDFAVYLRERPRAYQEAQEALRQQGQDRVLSEVEQILVSDARYGNADFGFEVKHDEGRSRFSRVGR